VGLTEQQVLIKACNVSQSSMVENQHLNVGVFRMTVRAGV